MLKNKELFALALSSVMFCARQLPSTAQAESYLLKDGTEVALKLQHKVASGKHSINYDYSPSDSSPAQLLVAKDVLADDGKTVLVGKWTPVNAETVLSPAEGMRGGSIRIDVRSTTAVDGSKIILSRHIQEKQLSGNPLKHAAISGVLLPLAIATGPLAIMASDGMFAKEGWDASIRAGTIVTATVKGTYPIDPASQSAIAIAPAREPFLATVGTAIALKMEQVPRSVDPYPNAFPLYRFTVVNDLYGEDGKTVLLRRGRETLGRSFGLIQFRAVDGSLISTDVPSLLQKNTMEPIQGGVVSASVHRPTTIWTRPRL